MNAPAEKKQPTHRAYFVKGEGDNAKWIELSRGREGTRDQPDIVSRLMH